MAKKHSFQGPVEFNKFEAYNMRLQNLFILPPEPFEGQVIYRSDIKVGSYYDGTNWIFFGKHNLLSDLQGGKPAAGEEPAQYWHLSEAQTEKLDSLDPKTKLGYKFTVVPNVDSDDETVGVTGMTYNTITHEYVFSYYAFERESKLWFYGRNSENLLPYSPSGTLTPTPDREIDLSAYLYHIQGVAFDETDGGYYVLGSINAVSSDTQRKIIKVDDEGTLLESTNLSSLSFQAGMLVLNNSANQLVIKPNNSTNVYFLNKATKALERTEVAHTTHEGLAYDPARKALWIGGDSGEIKVYDYDSFDVIYETTFETLPNESSAQNIEGMYVDPVDDRLMISFDAYLHGTNNNGNCMWKFDFPQMVYANASVENPYTIKADYLDPTQPRAFGGGGENINTLPSGNFAAALSSAATGKPFSTAAGLISFGLQSAAQSTRLIGGRLGDDNLWFANGPLATAYRQVASREWAQALFNAIYAGYVPSNFAAAVVAAAFGSAGQSISTLPNGTYIANLSSAATGLPVAANFAGLLSWGGSLANNQSARLLASRDNSDNLWFSSGPASNTYRQVAFRDWVTAFSALFVSADFAKTVAAAIFGAAGENLNTLAHGTYIANISNSATGKPFVAVGGLISFGGAVAGATSARILASRDGSDNLWFQTGAMSNPWFQIAERTWVTAAIAVLNTSIAAGYAGKIAANTTPPSSNFAGDANAVLGNGILWCLDSVTNLPEASAGMLVTSCSVSAATAVQTYTTSVIAVAPRMYIRRFVSGAWGAWVLLGGGDVTQAGTNAFTGANSFATPPTSAADATTANQLVRFSQLPFLQKFVRTQTGTYNPTVTGTTETNLFETNFGWLGINNAESRIIKIRLATQLNASSGSDVTFTLKIGATAYSAVTISPAATTEAVVEYVVTFGGSNSKKIIGTVMEEITGFKMGTNLVTIDMSSNLDIFIAGTFLTSDAANGFSVSQVTVEVV